MSKPLPTPPAAVPPAALAAFLRGVARRATVFAELQCGDAARADAAVQRALRDLAHAGPDLPMPEWPRRFWRALLADPALASPGPGRFLPGASPAVRAAVLLRLAAGLDEAHAADVLGVTPARVREALRRALPVDADDRPDAELWRRWQADIQRRVREAPEARVPAPSAAPMGVAPRRRLPRRAVAAVAAAVVVALAATVALDRRGDDPIGRAVALPPAGEPESRYSDEAGLVAHPDFDRLSRPDEARLADDAAYLAWTIGRVAVPAASAASAEAEAEVLPEGPAEHGEATDAP